MNNTIEVKRDDLEAVCNALIEDAIEYTDGDYECGYSCNYCESLIELDLEDFRHELNCPVLVAQDIRPIGEE